MYTYIYTYIYVGAVKVMDSMPKWEDAEPLLRASGAVFVRSLTLQAVLTTATAQAARVGTTAVAAHQVCTSPTPPPLPARLRGSWCRVSRCVLGMHIIGMVFLNGRWFVVEL